jgi:hypothetical protein
MSPQRAHAYELRGALCECIVDADMDECIVDADMDGCTQCKVL